MKYSFLFLSSILLCTSNPLFCQQDSVLSKPGLKIKFSPLALIDRTLILSIEKPLSEKAGVQLDFGNIFNIPLQHIGETVKIEFRYYLGDPDNTARFYVAPQIMYKYTIHHEDRIISGQDIIWGQPYSDHYIYEVSRNEFAGHLKFGCQIEAVSNCFIDFYVGWGGRNVRQKVTGNSPGTNGSGFNFFSFAPQVYDSDYAINFNQTFPSAQGGITFAYRFH